MVDCSELAGVNLHDAEILVCEEHIARHPYRAGPVAVLSVKQKDEVVTLIYQLAGPVTKSATPSRWTFSLVGMHWLYDELDCLPEQADVLVHRVLSSDGRVTEFPFESLLAQRIPLRTSAEPAKIRRVAS